MGKMIAALKKLGNKLNGKVPVMDNTVGVINEIADDYEKPDLTPYATKTYVDGLMSGALKRQIVQALPVTNIDTNTIYMVLDQEASQQGNVYNEYLYINNTWELIGTTAMSGVEVINLADYVGQHITYEQLGSVMDNRAKFKYNDVEVFSVGGDGEGHWIFTSTVRGGEYLQVTFTKVNEDEVPYFTFEVETISIGGGGSSQHHIEVYTHGKNISGSFSDSEIKNIVTSDGEVYPDAYITLYVDSKSPVYLDEVRTESVVLTCFPNRYISSGTQSTINFLSVDGNYNIKIELSTDENDDIDGGYYYVYAGAQPDYIIVKAYQGDPYVALKFTMQCDDLSVNTYADLVNYMRSKWMYSFEDESGTTIRPSLPVWACGNVNNEPLMIRSIFMQYVEGEGMALMLNTENIYESSGAIVMSSGYIQIPNNENFKIYRLNSGNFWHIEQ